MHSSPLSVRRLASLALCVLLAGATGCMFARNQLNVVDFEQRVAGIQLGSTTVAELEGLVGPPTSITPIGDKRLHVYAFSDSKMAGLSLIILNINKTNTGFDTALVLVNAQNVIETYTVSRNSRDLPWQWWAFGD